MGAVPYLPNSQGAPGNFLRVSDLSPGISKIVHGGQCRGEARESFKMARHVHVKVEIPNEDEKQAEAAKTVRLRALRLAREATDQEEASREVARTALKSRGPRINHPTPQAS
jgi:hypothetical protein